MHRSGTSMLAGILKENGLELGKVNESAPNNRKGNQELTELSKVHEQIFLSRNASWHSPPAVPIELDDSEQSAIETLLNPFRSSPFWGFKDPRTIWLTDYYLTRHPAAHLIGIVRHPYSVARSLAARPGNLNLPVKNGLALWLQTNRRLLDLCEQRPFPILFFDKPSDPAGQFVQQLRRFLSRFNRSDPTFRFFSETLVHQNTITDIVEPEIDELFDALIERSRCT